MSSLVILAATVVDISCWKPTNTQFKRQWKPYSATAAVGVGNYEQFNFVREF